MRSIAGTSERSSSRVPAGPRSRRTARHLQTQGLPRSWMTYSCLHSLTLLWKRSANGGKSRNSNRARFRHRQCLKLRWQLSASHNAVRQRQGAGTVWKPTPKAAVTTSTTPSSTAGMQAYGHKHCEVIWQNKVKKLAWIYSFMEKINSYTSNM